MKVVENIAYGSVPLLSMKTAARVMDHGTGANRILQPHLFEQICSPRLFIKILSENQEKAEKVDIILWKYFVYIFSK
jgi:hypothetical protein